MTEWDEAIEAAAKVADVFSTEIVPELEGYDVVDPATLPLLFSAIATRIRKLKTAEPSPHPQEKDKAA